MPCSTSNPQVSRAIVVKVSLWAHEGTPFTELYLRNSRVGTSTPKETKSQESVRAHDATGISALNARLERDKVRFSFVLWGYDSINSLSIKYNNNRKSLGCTSQPTNKVASGRTQIIREVVFAGSNTRTTRLQHGTKGNTTQCNRILPARRYH
jgi:hypothetical protein